MREFTAKKIILKNAAGEYLIPYVDNTGSSGNITIESSYTPPLLSTIWSDHLINDIQWLRADTFSWQDGNMYNAVYDKLVEEYNTGVDETEGSINFKRTTNEFKIADSTQEQAILDKYNSDGIAWYYILDIENKRFKLPRTKFGFEGLRDSVGNDIAESLPNITGKFIAKTLGTTVNGAFSRQYFQAGQSYWSGTDNNPHYLYNFDASRSSTTYKDNAPVQEHATQMYLYFYVGNFKQTAIEQTAGINIDLFNNKLDLNASNLDIQGKSYVSSLCMPTSINKVDIAIPANNTIIEADKDCLISMVAQTNASVSRLEMIVRDADGKILNQLITPTNANGYYIAIWTFLPKGHNCQIMYNGIKTSTGVIRKRYLRGNV